MGYLLQADAEDAQPLASNRGWSDFRDWLSNLPNGEYPTLRHLGEYGWTGKLDALTAEVGLALKEEPPSRDDVRATADNLLTMLRAADGAEVVSVTDGLSSG